MAFQSNISKALFIGINYFGTESELDGCVDDVKKMRDALGNSGTFVEQNRILVDKTNFVGCSASPTKQNITRGMKWLVENAVSGQNLFLFFSGHGGRVIRKGKVVEQTLVPVDHAVNGRIASQEIFDIVVRDLPLGVHVTAVMDCCFSGNLMNLQYHYVGNNGFVNQKYEPHQADVLLISACATWQVAEEVSSTSGTSGACTDAICAILQTTAQPTMGMFIEKLRESITRKGLDQVPQITSSTNVTLELPFRLCGPLFSPSGRDVDGPSTASGYDPQTSVGAQWVSDKEYWGS